MRKYSEEPEDHRAFTEDFDRFYTRFAGVYDLLVKAFPLWKKWLRRAVPYLVGPRILEVSFGTGWLTTQYADRFEVHGVDLNNRMVDIAQENLDRSELSAKLQQGNVELDARVRPSPRPRPEKRRGSCSRAEVAILRR